LTKDRRVCIGAFAGAHGVKGQAKVKAFTEEEKGVASYGPVETEDAARLFTLKYIRTAKPGIAIGTAQEISSREEAQALAGARLYVARAALPKTSDEDEFYLEDLVGLNACTEDGVALGEIAAIHNFGAGDILELRSVPGRKSPLMIPFTKTAAPVIDLEAGYVEIALSALDELVAKPPNDKKE